MKHNNIEFDTYLKNMPDESGYFGKNEWCKIADTENESPYIIKSD